MSNPTGINQYTKRGQALGAARLRLSSALKASGPKQIGRGVGWMVRQMASDKRIAAAKADIAYYSGKKK